MLSNAYSIKNPNDDDSDVEENMYTSTNQQDSLRYGYKSIPTQCFKCNVTETVETLYELKLDSSQPEANDISDIMDPWSSDLHDEEAPEDAETPQPTAFGVPLSYMNKTMEQATEDFFQMIQTRVSYTMADSTDVVKQLKTKYLAVFVTQNWVGITGIPPVVIEVTGELPSFKKPRARPINPKLMTKAHDEFIRLMGYFYAPSTSP
jgi:hypothetical protein